MAGKKSDKSCVMRNTSRDEFKCPESVVKKCGLKCTQKGELGFTPIEKKKKRRPKPNRNHPKSSKGKCSGRADESQGRKKDERKEKEVLVEEFEGGKPLLATE